MFRPSSRLTPLEDWKISSVRMIATSIRAMLGTAGFCAAATGTSLSVTFAVPAVPAWATVPVVPLGNAGGVSLVVVLVVVPAAVLDGAALVDGMVGGAVTVEARSFADPLSISSPLSPAAPRLMGSWLLSSIESNNPVCGTPKGPKSCAKRGQSFDVLLILLRSQ